MIDRIMNINTVDRSNKLFKSMRRLDESSSNHRYKRAVRHKQRLFIFTGTTSFELLCFVAKWKRHDRFIRNLSELEDTMTLCGILNKKLQAYY